MLKTFVFGFYPLSRLLLMIIPWDLISFAMCLWFVVCYVATYHALRLYNVIALWCMHNAYVVMCVCMRLCVRVCSDHVCPKCEPEKCCLPEGSGVWRNLPTQNKGMTRFPWLREIDLLLHLPVFMWPYVSIFMQALLARSLLQKHDVLITVRFMPEISIAMIQIMKVVYNHQCTSRSISRSLCL